MSAHNDNPGRSRILLLPSQQALLVWSNRHSDDDPTRLELWARKMQPNLQSGGDAFKLLELPVFGNDDQGIDSAEIVAAGPAEIWATFSNNSGRDGDGRGVYGWKFNHDGEQLDEPFQVNSTFSGSQGVPRIASDSMGSGLVAWLSEAVELGERVVRFQRIDGSSNVGDELAATLSTSKRSSEPSVAASLEGSFYLAWKDEELDGTSAISVGHHIDAEGNDAFSSTVILRDYSATNTCCVDLTTTGDDAILVAWGETTPQSGTIRTRRIESNLSADGPIQTISATASQVSNLRIVFSPSATHALCMWEERNSGEEGRAFGVLVGSDGAAVGEKFPLGGGAASAGPHVAFISDSEFIATWTDLEGGDGRPSRVRAQRFRVGSLGPTCGDANDDGFITASDALSTLQVSVGIASCETCLCDADGSGKISVVDALAILRASVQQGTLTGCPLCP